jgi:hypothetical protein
MRIQNIIFLILGLFSTPFQGNAQRNLAVREQSQIFMRPEQDAFLKERFKQVKVVRIDLPALYQLSHSKKTDIPVTLSDGQHVWNMLIEENELRSLDYKREITTDSGRIQLPREACGTFKGYEKSDPESWVRMNIWDYFFSAVIHVNGETYYAELMKNILPEMDESLLLIYREDDVISTNLNCPNESLHQEINQSTNFIESVIEKKYGKQNFDSLSSQMSPGASFGSVNNSQSYQPMLSTAASNCRKLEFVTESDYENYNSGSLHLDMNMQLANMNNVEPLFLNQYGVKFFLRYQHEWTVPSPYTLTNVCAGAYDRLDEYTNYWNNPSHYFYNHIVKDIGIMYSGINFDNNVVGCASTGAIDLGYNSYHNNLEYMIIQSKSYSGSGSASDWPTASLTALTGHELGHIMGATHVNGSNLMNPTLSSATNWMAQSINEINSILQSQNTIKKLSERYFILPITVGLFGPWRLNGGEVYIMSSVSNPTWNIAGLSIEGLDLVEVKGSSTISTSSISNVTLKIAPCNNSGW